MCTYSLFKVKRSVKKGNPAKIHKENASKMPTTLNRVLKEKKLEFSGSCIVVCTCPFPLNMHLWPHLFKQNMLVLQVGIIAAILRYY